MSNASLFGRRPRARLLLLALGLAGARPGQAQQVLVQGSVAADTLKPVFGPNRRLFGHAYVAAGLLAGPGTSGARLRYGWASAEARAGGRLKLRLNSVLALCADGFYAYRRAALAQEPGKRVPGPALHLAESLGWHQLGTEWAVRLNYGRRGNAVGSYLDLLAGGTWAVATRHRTQEPPAPGVGALEITESGLPYLRRWGATAGARLGFDRYAVQARYRLGSAYAPAYADWPELPRWVLGVELGLF